ncbi:ATP-binding protein, partial [bacterium]|nr:ATP-binding protein [bacterium]
MIKRSVMKEITVPAQISNVKKLRNFVLEVLRKGRISPEIISRYRLAVEEASVNIVKHGYRQKSGLITLRIVVERRQIIVSLLDNGLFYDLRQKKDPNLKQYVEERHRGGLGIFMIRKLMDEIDYSKTGKGNQLRMMIKRKKGAGRGRFNNLRDFFLKNKYTGISATALTLVIVIIYLFFYFHSKKELTQIYLDTGMIVSESLATALKNDVEESGLFNDLTLAPKVNEKRLEFNELIWGILVVETDSNIYYSTHNSILGKYQPGVSAEVLEPNVRLSQVLSGEWVYDLSSEITSLSNQNMGQVHILLRQKYIDAKIRQKQLSYLTRLVIILLAGYLVIIGVIHAAVSPIRNLARDIGSKNPMALSNGLGGELQDINKIKNSFQEYQERERGLRERLSEQDKMKAEMQKAQNIQKQLLPKNYPKLEGFDIFALYEAASIVGGDYFDFIHVDEDLLGVIIADVAGKGTAGAMFMTMVRTMLWSASRGVHRAADVLINVNSDIDEGHVKGPFITAFYLVLDTKKRSLN